jgi:uncharacterized protein involved in exopolysaccharide biosynthesis
MKLDNLIAVISGRRWLVFWIFVVVFGWGTALNFLIPKQYAPSAVVLIDTKNFASASVRALSEDIDQRLVREQIALLSSYNMAMRVVTSMGLDKSTEARQLFLAESQGKGSLKGWLAQSLLDKLQIKARSDSNVVEIEFTSTDGQFAASVANAYVQAYIKAVADNQSNSSMRQSQFVQRQLADLRESIRGVEEGIDSLQQRDEYFGITERLDVESRRLADLRSKLSSASTTTPESALSQIRSDFEVQRAKVLETKALLAKLKALQSNLEAMKHSYDFAQQKFWQESLNERPEVLSVVSLRTAEAPDTPAVPRLWINLPLALLIGLILGAGAALAAELADRRVRTESDAAEVLSLPVLATVAL